MDSKLLIIIDMLKTIQIKLVQIEKNVETIKNQCKYRKDDEIKDEVILWNPKSD